MKKHYILLWVDEPGFDDPFKHGSWEEFVRATVNSLVQHAKTIEGIETLGASAWLIPRDSGLPFVAECMGRALASKHPPVVHYKFLEADS
jgi:hypothetical protein